MPGRVTKRDRAVAAGAECPIFRQLQESREHAWPAVRRSARKEAKVMDLSGDEIARILYVAILGGALLGYALIATRGGIGQILRHLMLWALLFIGVAAAYGIWQDSGHRLIGVQQERGGVIELQRGRSGHFHIELKVTGPSGAAETLRFMIDTGASDMVLSRADAERLGYGDGDLAFLGTARTANGIVRTARVWLDQVRLGSRSDRRVPALVNEGELHVSLLGMGYLDRFSRIEITRNTMRIEL